MAVLRSSSPTHESGDGPLGAGAAAIDDGVCLGVIQTGGDCAALLTLLSLCGKVETIVSTKPRASACDIWISHIFSSGIEASWSTVTCQDTARPYRI